MIWELVGKFVVSMVSVFGISFAWCAYKDRRIQHIAWQKRVQADMATNREATIQRLADIAICNELELLPASEESND